MKYDWPRLIGWAIPLVCITLAGYLTFSGHSRLEEAREDLRATQLREASAAAAKDQAEKESGTIRYAAVPPSTSEEPKFLNGMRGHAASRGIEITKWTGYAAEAAGANLGNGLPADAPVDPAIKSIIRIKGDATLFGTYQGIRDFLNDMVRSNRLYTISNMKWARKNSYVELTATITRYIDPTLTPADIASGSNGRS